MKHTHILIVDDSPVDLMIIEAILESREYTVQTAESGEDAIALIQAAPPDLILLDGLMPGINGFETCRRIRAVEDWATIPIIMVTGLSSCDERLQALEAGAQDFLSKPVNEVELQARVNNLLQNKALYDQLAERNRALQESEERFRDLVENINDILYAVNEEGVITYLSPAITALSGHSPTELIGHAFTEFFHPDDQASVMDSFQQTVIGGEGRVLTKSGESRWVQSSVRPIMKEGRVKGIQGVITDVTARKQAEMALLEAREQEIDIGFKIQHTLLLGQLPHNLPHIQVAAFTTPSQRIDGDFYDFFTHGEQCLDVIVGDVMGKGVPAALLGAATKSHILRAMSALICATPHHVPTPQQILTSVHATVIQQLLDLESFITLCYARFDLAQKRLDFVDCGHTRTIHWQQRTGMCRLLSGENIPLGCLEDEVHVQVSVPIELQDTFVFYSDGVTEAQNATGEFFGEEGLLAVVEANGECPPEELREKIHQAVVAFSHSETFCDDLTCVVVKLTEAGV